jgi:hypothetical protein
MVVARTGADAVVFSWGEMRLRSRQERSSSYAAHASGCSAIDDESERRFRVFGTLAACCNYSCWMQSTACLQVQRGPTTRYGGASPSPWRKLVLHKYSHGSGEKRPCCRKMGGRPRYRRVDGLAD